MQRSRSALESPKRSPGTHHIATSHHILALWTDFSSLTASAASFTSAGLLAAGLLLAPQQPNEPAPRPQGRRAAGARRTARCSWSSPRGARGGDPGGAGTSASQSEDPSSITERQIIAFEHYLLQFNCIDLLPVQ